MITVTLCFLSQLVTRTKKIFVGGLSVNTTIEDVKQYFDQFGKVSEPMIIQIHQKLSVEKLQQAPGSKGVIWTAGGGAGRGT